MFRVVIFTSLLICVMRLVCVRRPLPFCPVYIPCTCVYLIIITIVLTTCQCVRVHATIVLKQYSTHTHLMTMNPSTVIWIT